jgi:integrase
MKVHSDSPDFLWTTTAKEEVEFYRKTNLKGSVIGWYHKPKGRNHWQVRLSWKGRRISINRYLDGTPLDSQGQAVRVLEKIRAEVDQGIFDPANWAKDKPQVFQNAWELYQQQFPVKRDRAKQREMIFKCYFLPFWNDRVLRDIEEHHILEWTSTLHGFKGKEISPSYRRLIVVTLKAFLNSFNVVRRKSLRFPTIKVPKKVQPWLSQEEQLQVIEFIPIQHKGIIIFIVTYGCRPSEACNLKKTDTDWEKRVIILRDRKNSQDNTLPILPEIEPILREQRKVSHWEYQFSTSRGLPYLRQTLYSIWIQASKQANEKYGTRIIPLRNASRHSLASRLINEDDTPIPVIARILGNSPSQIERVYGKVTVKKLAKVLELKKKVNE